MTIDYLLDTNIIIMLLERDPWTKDYISRFDFSCLGVSIITYLEVLMGLKDKKQAKAKKILNELNVLELDHFIAEKVVAELHSRNLKNLKYSKLPDMIIAQTALRMAVPLITYNKADFKGIKGLQVLAP